MESTPITRVHINAIVSATRGNEYIHNVYELPSIEPTIRYHHVAVGFSTEESWLQAIRWGNYNSWPLINIKNVARYFPESEENQKGHMRGQRQGVRSTKKKQWDNDATSILIEPTPHIRKEDVMICVYDLNSTMYTDQMGLFPQILSLDNSMS